MEHFFRQDSYLGEYVLENHHALARLLADGGVQAIFTGHGHAQDITVERFDKGSFLFDIQTGSLSSFPDPYRIVETSPEGRMNIESRHVTGFGAYPEERMRRGLTESAISLLGKLFVSGKSAALIAKQGVEAGIGFSFGDESGRDAEMDLADLDCWPAFVAGFLRAPLSYLGTDLIPVDNDISINLTDGSWN
jgi:hypothetical protein